MSSARDPVRLVADASAPDAERVLLRHGVDIAPPGDAEARVWQALGGALGVAAVATAAEASAKTVTAGTKVVAAGMTGAKIAAVAVGLAGLVATGGYLLLAGGHSPSPGAAPPAAGVAPAPAVPPPVPAPPAPLPPPNGAAPPAEALPAPPVGHPEPSAPPAHRTAIPGSAIRLKEETTLVRDARQALRQGDAGRALRLLDECRRLFPRGVLEQERERLAIEALGKSGRTSEASARAATFLRRHPDSPHADEIRGLGFGAPARR